MILVYFLCACIIIGLIYKATRQEKIFDLTFIFLVAQAMFLLYTILRKNSTETGIFTYDSLGILFFGVLVLVAFAVFYHSKKYLDREDVKQTGLYNIAFVSLCASITGAYFSNNVTATWVLIEATTLGSAVLIYHRRTERALEAAWKYVFVCSIGILIAYLGILFLSTVLKNHHGNMSFGSLSEAIPTANPLYLKLAFVLVLTGYSCKMEYFPLYPIGIDANHVTPTPMSAFFSTAMVNLGFVSIFRIYSLLFDSPIFSWAQNVMFVAGFTSLLVAAVYIAQVEHCKRLLAYSTVENMGIALLILSTGEIGAFYAIFHVLMHSFVKSTAFMRLSVIGKTYGSYKLENLGGYRQISPKGSLILILCLLGLTAIPPSALFISEIYVFSALSKNIIALILLIPIICIILYFLCTKLLKIVYGDKPENIVFEKEDKLTLWIQFVLLAIFFFFGMYQPQWLTDMILECKQDIFVTLWR
ncbi:MAG: hydrogenase 4 subunit F [Prevotellaceae bacterium]|jgi:hydrogenase-4 component F|nr:hydrogenase 4 subunit F [Prevotellaceae bacterium]